MPKIEKEKETKLAEEWEGKIEYDFILQTKATYACMAAPYLSCKTKATSHSSKQLFLAYW